MARAAEHFNSSPVRPGRRSGNSAKHSAPRAGHQLPRSVTASLTTRSTSAILAPNRNVARGALMGVRGGDMGSVERNGGKCIVVADQK